MQNTNTEQSEPLTVPVDEAARRLGIARATAYEGIRRNEIPHVKIGRRILVPLAALHRMLDSASGGTV